jgi:hypothetical protein
VIELQNKRLYTGHRRWSWQNGQMCKMSQRVTLNQQDYDWFVPYIIRDAALPELLRWGDMWIDKRRLNLPYGSYSLQCSCRSETPINSHGKRAPTIPFSSRRNFYPVTCSPSPTARNPLHFLFLVPFVFIALFNPVTIDTTGSLKTSKDSTAGTEP